jgi:WD40 repeat protein
LAKDPGRLAGKLTGRLRGVESPELEDLVRGAGRGPAHPWLRPETASLTPPGGPLLRTLEGHTDGVRAVAVLADGRRAVSGSRDNTLRLWDLESGEVIATFTGDAAITCVAVARDDLFVAGSANGAVHILRLIE